MKYEIIGQDEVISANSEREAIEKVRKSFPEFGRNFRLRAMKSSKNENDGQQRGNFRDREEVEAIYIPKSRSNQFNRSR